MADGKEVEYPLMNLHQDREIFAELIEVTGSALGLPQVYVEKDYWITMALKFLSESPYVKDVIFKGGTSLSKAYRLIHRFSEDIDLAVSCSSKKGDNQRKKLLKNVENVVAQSLISLKGDERESKCSKFRKTVYQYPRSVDDADFGQASRYLLIEINASTDPEPFEMRELRTFIAEELTKENRTDLITRFGLEDFSIRVLSPKRTLVEKMLGIIRDSYSNNPIARLSDRIHHLYDICMVLRNDEYKDFVISNEFKLLCGKCIKDEKAGKFEHSDCFEKPLVDAPLFSDFETWRSSLNETYTGVFSRLVYSDDLPDMDEISDTLNFLQMHLD